MITLPGNKKGDQKTRGKGSAYDKSQVSRAAFGGKHLIKVSTSILKEPLKPADYMFSHDDDKQNAKHIKQKTQTQTRKRKRTHKHTRQHENDKKQHETKHNSTTAKTVTTAAVVKTPMTYSEL